MALRLTARDREALAATARSNADARETRQALALLDLDVGESPTQVTKRYRVGRSTVHEWAAPVGETDRTPGRPHPGRRPVRTAASTARIAGSSSAGPAPAASCWVPPAGYTTDTASSPAMASPLSSFPVR
ncbi:COG3415 family protein [Urbifossiella limnaea]|uniref:hypothetical protein n=1 Tax=Urbifossiella limnaea TaxID=2528023 RepID=UPI0011A7C8FF|nr:hypothetical protein [Urbifossiella limnaea]